MTLENRTLELDELTIRVTHDGDVSRIVWTGVSEFPDPEVTIGPFLRGLIPNLVNRKLVMDFRNLEYLNSATLQPLFAILKELNTNKIETVLLYDPEVEWQRISFRSIKAVITTLSSISFASS